ncbi:hypothetical protein [Nocardia terpenica]|uniref:Uncharacterized protein n=1 Tax=Nocardia terpenica TaxID=455432 RepID=A0A164I9P5_9NOCA|nr:hypothetical protein [Nocardia terpenica]KZM69229.1 hypothetical protein AWN90_16090 [Nocardia terpenica]
MSAIARTAIGSTATSAARRRAADSTAASRRRPQSVGVITVRRSQRAGSRRLVRAAPNTTASASVIVGAAGPNAIRSALASRTAETAGCRSGSPTTKLVPSSAGASEGGASQCADSPRAHSLVSVSTSSTAVEP